MPRYKKPKPRRAKYSGKDSPALDRKATEAAWDSLLDGESEDEADRKAKLVKEQGEPRQRKIGPVQREKIAEMRLRHMSFTAIGKKLGCSAQCVRHHFVKHIQPEWRGALKEDLARDLQEVDLLSRMAWEKFLESTKPEDQERLKQELYGADEKSAMRTVEKIRNRKWKVGDTSWLSVIQWCLDWKAKIFGSYSPVKHEIETTHEIRVAGRSPAELDREMLLELKREMSKRAAYEAANDRGVN